MNMKKDYQLKVVCGNCGTEQEVTVPFGVDVREVGGMNDKILIRSDGIIVDDGLTCFYCGSSKLSKRWD